MLDMSDKYSFAYIQSVKGVFSDVVRLKAILHETDDYVGAAKNDIIQPSCQHSPIPLSRGNVGPLG